MKIKNGLLRLVSTGIFMSLFLVYLVNGETQDSIQDIQGEEWTEVRIYTYSGDRYLASGNLQILENGQETSQIVMQLQGEISQHEPSEEWEIPEEVQAEGVPMVLHVYVGNEIYGFHSNNMIYVQDEGQGNHIEILGYLEAYSNGSGVYSS